MSVCYIHNKKQSIRVCSNCSKPICHICNTDVQVNQRVTAVTSVDREIRYDYIHLGPHCFRKYAIEQKFNIPSLGFLFSQEKIKQILFTLVVLGFIGNVIFYGVGWIFWLTSLIYARQKHLGQKSKYQQYLHSEYLISEGGDEQ